MKTFNGWSNGYIWNQLTCCFTLARKGMITESLLECLRTMDVFEMWGLLVLFWIAPHTYNSHSVNKESRDSPCRQLHKWHTGYESVLIWAEYFASLTESSHKRAQHPPVEGVILTFITSWQAATTAAVCVCICVCAQAMATAPDTSHKNSFVERILPESDNAPIVFMVFQGIKVKEQKKEAVQTQLLG